MRIVPITGRNSKFVLKRKTSAMKPPTMLTYPKGITYDGLVRLLAFMMKY